MRLKRFLFCTLPVFMCCLILCFSMAFPAMAVDEAYRDFQFLVDPVVVDLEYNPGDSDIPAFSFARLHNVSMVKNIPSVLIWLNDTPYHCDLIVVDQTAYYGNLSILDSALPDTGEDFVFGLGDYFLLVLSGDVSSVKFAVSPIHSSDITSSVEIGLKGVLHWVGQVLSALVSADGPLFPLIPLLAVFVAVPLFTWIIKAICSVIWGM